MQLRPRCMPRGRSSSPVIRGNAETHAEESKESAESEESEESSSSVCRRDDAEDRLQLLDRCKEKFSEHQPDCVNGMEKTSDLCSDDSIRLVNIIYALCERISSERYTWLQ